MNTCVDCNKPISPKSTRCKTCMNLLRWRNPDDPRRRKLVARNNQARNGDTPYTEREWLRSRYEDRDMSLRDIAKEIGCGVRTIARWMERHNIPTRDNLTAIRALDRKGPSNANWQGKSVCPKCGNKKLAAAKGCRKCYDKHGERNPRWTGLADISALVRQWARDNWRLQIFKRDMFTCQKCGDNRGNNLEAHHMQPLADIIHSERKQWTHPLDTPEQRMVFVEYLIAAPCVTSLDNGITLCEKCHIDAHARKYTKHHPQGIGKRTLNLEDRSEIKRIYAAGGISQKRLARRYRVSITTIHRLVRS